LAPNLPCPTSEEPRGCIVYRASVNGYFVEPLCAGYCATKGGIIALTKARAIDHGKDGIRVNCIWPGYIDSGLAWEYFEVQPNPSEARNAAGNCMRSRVWASRGRSRVWRYSWPVTMPHL
jgi:NAD(P)-dependent dehydrogenase (short-subunit alcohol dehydrogenase family)